MSVILEQFEGAKLLGFDGAHHNEIFVHQRNHEPRNTRTMNEADALAGYIAANEMIWGPLHELSQWAVRRPNDFDAYRLLNETMAEAVLRHVGANNSTWLFNNDYQFALVPEIFRGQMAGPAVITHYVHTPWPSPVNVPPTVRPVMDAVACGMLQSDFIGFHSGRWLERFLSYVGTLASGYQIETRGERPTIYCPDGHYCQLVVQPLGIRTAMWETLATGELTLANHDGTKIILAVERADYTKGVRNRFRAMKRLFEKYPHWRGKVTLIQIAAPTRENVPAFEQVWRECEEEESNVNGEFGTDDWKPIEWFKRKGGLKSEELAPVYRRADVIMVNPLADGCNLVAKEAPMCQSVHNPGVLCLSRGAGAWDEIGDYVVELNPHDVDQMADALNTALTMPLNERQRLNSSLKRAIRANPLEQWVELFYSLAYTKAAMLRQRD
jgi:trehalose-6-phosphate synthase